MSALLSLAAAAAAFPKIKKKKTQKEEEDKVWRKSCPFSTDSAAA